MTLALQPERELIFVQIQQGQALGTDGQALGDRWACWPLLPGPVLPPSKSLPSSVASPTAAAISASIASLGPDFSRATLSAPVAPQAAQDYIVCLLPIVPMDLSPCVRGPTAGKHGHPCFSCVHAHASLFQNASSKIKC